MRIACFLYVIMRMPMDTGMGHWGMWPPGPLFRGLWATAPER